MIKKKALFFAACDVNNFPYAIMFWNSMTKFHSPKDIDMIFYTTEKDPEKLKNLPEGIKVEDLNPFLEQDKMFWYRQKPVLAELHIKEYELVCGFDVDQIIVGNLDYIIQTSDYDVATVINWNRVDPQQYGVVQGWGILPPEYFNCGLVAMRNEAFIHQWKVLCFSPQFDRLQYKEQDLLNILCYYGNYNIRCLDHPDKQAGMTAWWGLISKGEWLSAILKENKLIVPKGQGATPFPAEDMELKVLHFAEGNRPNKMNYKTLFSEEVIARLDYLVSAK